MNLDFSRLTRSDHQGLFVSLDSEDEKAISVLSETSERVEGAIKFRWFVSSDAELMCVPEKRAPKMREAFLRASLAEYVSTEESLERDLNKLVMRAKILHIYECSNPLLHIIRLLT